MNSIDTNDRGKTPFLKQHVPLISWLPKYQSKWLRADFIAGITIWGTTVPTAMGYASLAGLPIQVGLYAAMVALVAYAIFGTSSLLKVETSPSMAILSATVVAPIAMGDYSYYVILSAALALVVGLILIAAGFARMGFLADFLAKPVVYGFLFGLAIGVIIHQLPSLFGLETSARGLPEQLWVMVISLDEANILTLMVSVTAFLVILLFKRRIPGFPGTLAMMGLSILVVSVFNLADLGVAIVGPIPHGLPQLQIPVVRPSDLLNLTLGATAMVFVALGESLGTARSFAAEHHNRIDTDQELVALGVANLGTGLMQGFAVGANPATTASANASRTKTQIASLITAAILLITITTRFDLIALLPQAVVAVAVIVSVSQLIDFSQLKRFYNSRKIDFVLALVALVGVILTGILVGLMIAVFLSLIIVLYRSSQPHIAILGRIPGHEAYGDISENVDAVEFPGLLIVRPDVPLFFVNASTMHSQIRSLVSSVSTPVEVVLIDLSASEDLDVACTDMFKNLYVELESANIQLLLTNTKSTTRERLQQTGVLEQIGDENIYLRIPEAVEAIRKSAIS